MYHLFTHQMASRFDISARFSGLKTFCFSWKKTCSFLSYTPLTTVPVAAFLALTILVLSNTARVSLRPGSNPLLTMFKRRAIVVSNSVAYKVCSTTVDSNVVLNSCWLAPSHLHETHASRMGSVSEDKIGPQIFTGTIYVHRSRVMTIIREIKKLLRRRRRQ